MKVRLAVQTISNSVADAIDYCRDILKLPQFVGSEATTQFIRVFDKSFDILNSRSFFGVQCKAALTPKNIDATRVYISETTAYIKKLTTY